MYWKNKTTYKNVKLETTLKRQMRKRVEGLICSLLGDARAREIKNIVYLLLWMIKMKINYSSENRNRIGESLKCPTQSGQPLMKTFSSVWKETFYEDFQFRTWCSCQGRYWFGSRILWEEDDGERCWRRWIHFRDLNEGALLD